MVRLENLTKAVDNKDNVSKFYKLPVQERLEIVNSKTSSGIEKEHF